MNKVVSLLVTSSLISSALLFSGCKKKEAAGQGSAAPSGTAASGAPTAPAPSAPTAADEAAAKEAAAKEAAERAAAEKAEKQALLAYSAMEDKYLNDPKGQWAVAAKASSSFGDADKAPPDSKDSSTPWQATGAPNGNTWSNNQQDMGFDWLEAGFAKPVVAAEVRLVLAGTIGALSKVEAIDEAGAAHEVWSGTDDTKRETRGPRTWVALPVPKGDYKTAKVKVTFANAVAKGYKEVDAVQLVEE
jgi:hypothetical protein